MRTCPVCALYVPLKELISSTSEESGDVVELWRCTYCGTTTKCSRARDTTQILARGKLHQIVRPCAACGSSAHMSREYFGRRQQDGSRIVLDYRCSRCEAKTRFEFEEVGYWQGAEVALETKLLREARIKVKKKGTKAGGQPSSEGLTTASPPVDAEKTT